MVPLAAGTALGVAASVVPALLLHEESTEEELVLEYRRNNGWHAWPKTEIPDPGAKFERVADYPVFLVDRCAIQAWSMTNNFDTTDVDQTVWLRMNSNELSDEQFNCLAEAVQPPFVRLRRERV